MELQILNSADTLEESQKFIEEYFDSKVRIIQIDLSMYEQYRIYPGQHKYIPKLHTYRVVCRKGKYHFGTI